MKERNWEGVFDLTPVYNEWVVRGDGAYDRQVLGRGIKGRIDEFTSNS